MLEATLREPSRPRLQFPQSLGPFATHTAEGLHEHLRLAILDGSNGAQWGSGAEIPNDGLPADATVDTCDEDLGQSFYEVAMAISERHLTPGLKAKVSEVPYEG